MTPFHLLVRLNNCELAKVINAHSHVIPSDKHKILIMFSVLSESASLKAMKLEWSGKRHVT